MFGILDIVGVEVRNREQVEVRENVEARERKKTKQRNNKRSDMWMNMFYADMSCDTLRHNVMCA